MRIASFSFAGEGPLPLWPPLLATRGPGRKSARHAHHALHVVLATKGDLEVRVGSDPPSRAAGLITSPDVAHALDASRTEVLLVFFDPESQAGASRSPSIGDGVRMLTS